MKIQIVSESVNVRTSLVLEINSMVLVASSLKLIPTFGALKVTGLTFETLVLLKLRSQVAEYRHALVFVLICGNVCFCGNEYYLKSELPRWAQEKMYLNGGYIFYADPSY